MKRSRFLARTRTFTAGISGRLSRRAPTPSTSSACRSSPRNRPRGSRSTCLTRRRSSPRNWCRSCPVGRLVLNRNPDNFFAETEQVAFCVAHVVPGIDFSNDPLLAGRIHSYVDTQISRLGGPNFHEIPINAPVAQVHNNQRDGMHRQAIHRGRVSYEPNSLAGGCPFQAGKAGFMSFPEPRQESEHKVRGKAERFADHYTQATLFWNSQTDIEKQHIIGAFRFELSRVQTPAVRERMVSGLMNVASELATAVATGLGIREMPEPMPRAMTRTITPEVSASSALSLFARPGDGTIRARRVAVLVADGCDAEPLLALTDRLISEGAVPRFVSTRLGPVDPSVRRDHRGRRQLGGRALGSLRRRGPAERGLGHHDASTGRTHTRVLEGSVSPLQAAAGSERCRLLCCRPVGSARCSRPASPIRASSSR